MKWELRHLLRTSTQGSEKFQAEPVSFYFLTKKKKKKKKKKKAYKCSLDLLFYTLIIGYSRSTQVQFRMVTLRLVIMIDYDLTNVQL